MLKDLAPAQQDELAALIDIAVRSVSLDERLDTRPESDDFGGQGSSSSILQAWSTIVGQGNAETFSRRLGWDGLDRAQITRLVPVDRQDAQSWPSWLSLLRRAYCWADQGKRLDWGGASGATGASVVDATRPLPFEQLFLPLVACAAQEVRRRSPAYEQELSEAARSAFERGLLTQLTRICAQALYVTFKSAPNPTYEAFLTEMKTGGLLSFYREHSVAARLVGTTSSNWIEFVVEFSQRLECDRGLLQDWAGGEQPIGQLASVQIAVSDSHEAGRAVVICQFSSGLRVVYKPRPVGLEGFFSVLVSWCNQRSGDLQLRTARVLPRPTHGWIEWIAAVPCSNETEVRRYYQRCGMLMAVVHAVHGSDVHSGNLLASGEYPVLIDVETLLTPAFELVPGPAAAESVLQFYERAGSQAVTRTLMPPWLKFTADGRTVELGGLTTSQPAPSQDKALVWCEVNTDAMRLGPGDPPSETVRNLPTLNDREVVATGYLQEVLTGFRQMYRILQDGRDVLLAPGGILDQLSSQEVRFIFRHTSLYASLLERTLHPKFLHNGAERSVELDVLARPLLEAGQRPVVWPFLRAERDALEQMDVPLFSVPAGSVNFRLPTGEVIDNCFRASAASEARRKLGSLNDSDRRIQEALITAAFAGSLAPGLAATKVQSGAVGSSAVESSELSESLSDSARREAERLADLLSPRAFWHEGAPMWPAPAYFAPARRHAVGCGRTDLLDGSAGIGLAMAAIALVTGRSDIADLSLAAFKPLCLSSRDLAARLARGTWDIGLGTGVASCGYGLLRASDLLNAPALLAAAASWAQLIEPANFSPKAGDDLLSGRAGGLLLLVRLYQRTSRAERLDQISRVARDLLSRRAAEKATGLKVWRARTGIAEVGLAHGQSGIAYALVEAAAVLGDSELKDAARDAMAYERTVLGSGFDRANGADERATWSYGSTGIGLARAAIIRHASDGGTRGDLEVAVRRTQQQLLDGPENICSGFHGRLGLLFAAAETLERTELREAGFESARRKLAAARVTGRYDLGWHNDYDHPGLFQGLAGVAYSWARLVDSSRIPDVAIWA